MSEKIPRMIFCNVCQKETEHSHLHDSVHGLEGTHMSGSERYQCVECANAIYKEEGEKKGLKFFLD
jgi:ribosomal protein L44E